MKKKVLVGMSGGIDSSVTACLLQKQGYEVVGVHMRFWSEKDIEDKIRRENRCCSIESWELAAEIAKKIGIEFHVLDVEKEFKETIVDYYLTDIKNGNTPNPCIECNRRIKFGAFLELMERMGADYVATGHYVRRVERQIAEDCAPADKSADGEDGNTRGKSKTKYELWTAADKAKDQSYFLYTLTQEKLAHTLFPLGEYTKPEVRKMAAEFGIDFINKKKESQDICFIPEETPGPFLQRNLDKSAFEPGPIMSVDGVRLGMHRGLPLYTIGQRKGIGLGGIKGDAEGEPWYVTGADVANNTLIVGKEKDLYKKSVRLKEVTFIDEPIEGDLEVKIRYRSVACAAKLQLDLENSQNSFGVGLPGQTGDSFGASLKAQTGILEFANPQRAVTAGQSAVFYRGEQVIGGGVMESE